MKDTIAGYNCCFPPLFRNKEPYADTNESISFHGSLTQSKQGSLQDNPSTKQQIECLNTFWVGWLRCDVFIYGNRDSRNLLVQQAHNRQGYCKLMQEPNEVYIKKDTKTWTTGLYYGSLWKTVSIEKRQHVLLKVPSLMLREQTLPLPLPSPPHTHTSPQIHRINMRLAWGFYQ